MTEIDNNFKLWLTARFDDLEKRMDGMLTMLGKAEKRQEQCRNHCDTVTSNVFDELATLKQHDLRAEMEWASKASREDQLLRREEHSTQQYQGLWIKAGALFTGAMVGVTLITLLLAHYWGKGL